MRPTLLVVSLLLSRCALAQGPLEFSLQGGVSTPVGGWAASAETGGLFSLTAGCHFDSDWILRGNLQGGRNPVAAQAGFGTEHLRYLALSPELLAPLGGGGSSSFHALAGLGLARLQGEWTREIEFVQEGSGPPVPRETLRVGDRSTFRPVYQAGLAASFRDSGRRDLRFVMEVRLMVIPLSGTTSTTVPITVGVAW